MLALIVSARAIRAFGFGFLSVTLALYLQQRGLAALAIGALLSTALVAGAAASAASAWLAQRLGRRGALLLGAGLLTASGVLLGVVGSITFLVLACLLGTISAGGQEVGSFAPIEQHIVADTTKAQASTRVFAVYNLVGAFALAIGALAAAAVPLIFTPWVYASCGVALLLTYAYLPASALDGTGSADDTHEPPAAPGAGLAAARRLAMLFGFDALAGGFVVQSFIAYWLHLRFGVDQRAIGFVMFGANTLAAFSYPVAAWLSTKIGLLRTMVFTHLPSNLLLCAVPLMPTFAAAAGVLLARFALSQMDVPTRQAFTMDAVPREDRAYAASLTNAVRPAAAAVAPVFTGLAFQTAAMGLPFFVAGGLKIIYDLAILKSFSGMSERQG